MTEYRLKRGIFPVPHITAEHVRAEVFRADAADGIKVRSRHDGRTLFIPRSRWNGKLAADYEIVSHCILSIFSAAEVCEGDYIVHTARGRYAVAKKEFERYYERDIDKRSEENG